MSEEPIITDFDNIIQDEHHQLLKAVLPYMQPNGQKFISLFVKFKELRNTMTLFQDEENNLSACSAGKRNLSPIEMLSDIRKFCPKKDQEAIDSLLNFINMYTLYNKYNQAFSSNSTSDDNIERLKSMLSPEQKNMFETFISNMS